MKRPPRPRRSDGPDLTMAPRAASGPGQGNLRWDDESAAYLLQVDDVSYRVPVAPEGEQDGLLRIDGRVGDGDWTPLLTSAGMLLRVGEGAVLPPAATHERCPVHELRHSARGRILTLKYGELLDERSLKRTVQVRMVGRALEIRVEAPAGKEADTFCGFALGPVGPEGARRVQVPGLPDPLLVVGNGFLSAYPDRYTGTASSFPPGGAFFRFDTEGNQLPVDAAFHLTLSPDPLDPLPSLDRPPAPHRADLETRVTLDFYSEAPYADDHRLLHTLAQYGFENVLLIYRNWQQYGYGRRGPLLYPADKSRGPNQAFREMISSATDAGWLVALREEYAAMADDTLYWDEKSLASWWDGEPRLSQRPHHHAIAADRMLDFARLEATKIERNYRPGAVFVDGHTAWNPEGGLRQVDDTPNSPSRAEPAAVRHAEGLLAFLRDVHEGPVIGSAGEGPYRFDTFAGGMAEAVIRGADAGKHAPLIVDYELREVRPKLLGLGAGSYRQFSGYPTDEPVEPGRIDWDAYRATEIALGHAGYVGNYRIQPGPRGVPFPGGSAAAAVREYYLLRALQELYLGAAVRSVEYRAGEEMLPLAEALRRGLDLVHAQVRVEYSNGLTVWVNRAARESWTVRADDAEFDLPPSGFVASAPRQKFLAYTALTDGQRTDFCRSALYTFADTRGGGQRKVEELTLDGSVAFIKSAVPGRQDLVLVGARQLTSGEEEYRLSERADIRLTHLSTRDLELTVMDTESGKPVNVAWPAFTAAWKGNKAQVLELLDGAWRPSRCQVQASRSGPQLSRALPGLSYRVSVPS